MRPEKIQMSDYYVTTVWECQKTKKEIKDGDWIKYLATCRSWSYGQVAMEKIPTGSGAEVTGAMLVRDYKTGEIIQLHCQSGFRLVTKPLVLLALQAGISME